MLIFWLGCIWLGIVVLELRPSCSVSPGTGEQMGVILPVAVWWLSGQGLVRHLKADMFCNVPKWWKKSFLTLDSKSVCALEQGDCHLYSRLYHCEQWNHSSDGWWASYSSFAVLLWENEFFTLDCRSKSHRFFLDFFVHCKMKIIPFSMILANTLRLSRTKWESQA